MKTISILIPAYNEQAVLGKLFTRLHTLADNNEKYDFEFFFVNDGSKDTTLEIIKEQAEIDTRVSYLNLSRNFGKEIAMIAALDHVSGDATVIIDADLQDPPELIPEMITWWEKGYDDVYAKRSSRLGESFLKKFTSRVFYNTLQSVTRIPIQKDTGDFRLLDRRAVEALKQIRESQRYTKGYFSWIGFKKKEITYHRDARAAGETHWNYFRLADLAIEGIVSFSIAPLRLATALGTAVAVATFIYLIVIVVRTIIFGTDLAGYPSTLAVILFLGGAQLLSLGIIGEYVGRIFNETKNRPLYLIEELHIGTSKKTR
ncbi:MAG: glycosyltransferase [Candidatus Microsaccharimonas sossegonensis]|uniref:Glycosyltransferase n=1 Tax=Candidatus Microsaccharimonas sossegonensis TaxID=2506948 RepID=A0A4V1J7E0_9BACT|nr:MAG: glycosyltransferase [Candidatus Microsaccharimonas sossegonensis]